MNNHYPTLSSQPIHPYIPTIPRQASSQPYHNVPTNQHITVGIPLSAQQISQLSPQPSHSAVPIPPNQQINTNYVQLPQQQGNTMIPAQYRQNYQLQRNNSNIRDQHTGYVELTENPSSEPSFAPLLATKANTSTVNEPTLPAMMCQQQLPAPMMTPQYPQYTQYPQLQNTIIDYSGTIVYDLNLLHGITSREPQLAHCPHCNKHVQTVVNYKVGKGTVLSGILMGKLLCSWVPCVIKDCKDAVHYCPVCGGEVGKKKFLFNC